MIKDKTEKDKDIPPHMRFIIGGMAGITAVIIIHPMDVLKNRMQLSGEGGQRRDHANTLHALRNIVSREGARGMYGGLSANILRQATYTTTRLGMYQNGIEVLSQKGYKGFPAQVASGLAAGLTAAFISAPTDVALVRMMSDGRLPPEQRRCYRHVGDAMARIAQEEGATVLWRGVGPAMLRAMVGSVSQLVTYSQTKHYLINKGLMQDGILCHFSSSLLSGLAYIAFCNPVDMAKSRIQAMFSTDGKPRYTGLVDCWTKTIQKEGVFGLWKGFLPYYLRMGPQTTLLLIFAEQFTYFYSVHILHNKDAHGF